MPTYDQVLTAMENHLSGTIAGRVEGVDVPEAALTNESTPYATVAPGREGEGIQTQSQDEGLSGQLLNGTLFITAWMKAYDERPEATRTMLLQQLNLLKNRALSCPVGRHFSVRQTDGIVSVDDNDGVLMRRTATVSFYWTED